MILSLLASALLAGPYQGTDSLKIIPRPVSVSTESGSFKIDASTSISRAARSTEDKFAADQLAEEIKADLGVQLNPSGTGYAHGIFIHRLETPVSEEDQGQGYRLDVAPDKVVVSAKTGAGIFYGIQTLKQIIRANRDGKSIPACHIEDWPVLKYRGWQDDISRGPISSLDFMKQQIRTLSEFKLNMFTLYTEHVFKLKKNPAIAPADGITADQVKELSEYGKKYHVELVGNFQSFGHFANILKVPGYQDLGENNSVISPAKEASYKFLGDVYSEIAPSYESPLFDINCDEVSGLGDGPSKDMVKEIGVAGVYAKHINRVVDLLRPYGKTPMMWGDIALNYPAIVPQLPKDLIVLPWAYDARNSFEAMILPFTKFGLRFMVCPGVSCWSQLWPNLQNATVNIANFTRDGARNGAMGCLNTCWDDDGQNLFNDNWYELVWGAECSWSPIKLEEGADQNEIRNARVASFNRQFPGDFYGLSGSGAADALTGLSALRRERLAGGLGDAVFWRDPVAVTNSIGDRDAGKQLSSMLAPIKQELRKDRKEATHNAGTLDYPIFAADQVEYIADSYDAVVEKDAGLDKMAKLAGTMKKLEKRYIALWNRENRRWWLDHNTARYETLEKQLSELTRRVVITSSQVTGIVGSGNVITMHALSPGSTIHYTLDGSNPTAKSDVFSGPVTIAHSCIVKAIGVWPNGAKSPIEAAPFYHLVADGTIRTNLRPYDSHVAAFAFDGSEDTYFWSDGAVNKGDNFTIVLDRPATLSSIKVLTGQKDHPADYLRSGEVQVSEDGRTFETVGAFTNGIAEASFAKRRVKSVRVRVTQSQEWWLAIREIELR